MLLSVNKKYPPEIGGVEFVSKELAEIGLQYYGNSKVLTFNQSFNLLLENINGVRVTRLKAISLGRSVRLAFTYGNTIKCMSREATIIVFHFPSFQPEVVIKNIKGYKICLYHADIVGKGLVGSLYNKIIVSRFLNSMDKIVVTSPNIIKSSPMLKNRNNIEIIPLGIDINHFNISIKNRREELIESFGTDQDTQIILFVGRLARYKGIDILIKSLSSMNTKYKLVLVTNDCPKKFKVLIEDLGVGDRIRFYKNIGYEELPSFYNSADVFCMPSTDRGEAFGLVAIEAMACGVPVVTTELGTGTSYHNIDGVTGRVVKPGDEVGLKEAIIDICNNKNLYNKNVVRDRAIEFSINNFNKKWIEIFKR